MPGSASAALPSTAWELLHFSPWNLFLWHLEALLAFPEKFPGSSSGPARCEVASCMKGFETQLDFDTAFAMVPVFVFTLVPQKAEFLSLVAKLTESHWLGVKCVGRILCFVLPCLLV